MGGDCFWFDRVAVNWLSEKVLVYKNLITLIKKTD